MILKETDRPCICLWCGRLVGVKKDNTLKSHRCAGGGKCEGSNKMVEGKLEVPENKIIEKDVHTEHCCVFHGCKYGNEDCSVKNREKPQSYPCEYCQNHGMDPTKAMPETSIYYFQKDRYYRRVLKKVHFEFEVEKDPPELLYVMDFLKDASGEVHLVGCFFEPTPFLPSYTVRFASQVKGVTALRYSEWVEVSESDFKNFKKMFTKKVTVG